MLHQNTKLVKLVEIVILQPYLLTYKVVVYAELKSKVFSQTWIKTNQRKKFLNKSMNLNLQRQNQSVLNGFWSLKFTFVSALNR